MTVYVDVVFMENLFMNYIILFATAVINKVEIKLIRILLSSILGSIYAVVAYTNILSNSTGVIIKILLSVAMIYIAFKPEGFKRFIKQLLIFYLATFTFGGVAFALLYFVKPGELLIENGIYIGTYPIKIVLLGGIVGFVIITIAFNLIKGKLSKNDMFCNISIYIDSKRKDMISMIDTGNLLKEPITGMPVIIVEKEELKDIIPMEILKNVNKIINGDIDDIKNIEQYISKFRVIPFNSLGKQNGLLLGIKADKIIVDYDENKIEHNNIIIGVYEKKLCKNDSYKALIGLDLLDRSDRKIEYFRNVKV